MDNNLFNKHFSIYLVFGIVWAVYWIAVIPLGLRPGLPLLDLMQMYMNTPLIVVILSLGFIYKGKWPQIVHVLFGFFVGWYLTFGSRILATWFQ